MLEFLKTLVAIPIFPLYLVFDALSPIKFFRLKKQGKLRQIFRVKPILKTLVQLALAILVLLPLWVSFYTAIGITVASRLKLLEEPIPVSGTGSMYPTFPKGVSKDPKEQSKELVATPGMLPYPNGLVVFPDLAPYFSQTPLKGFFGQNFFGHSIARGDIVVFENEATRQLTEKMVGKSTGLVKRVVALGGDTLEIRDGLLYINSEPQSESYTARARSTFGGDFLPDCRKIVVPDGKLFVMGDNRKGSSDSRHELGFISVGDVDHVLPLEKQIGELNKNWRNTANDLSESSKIKLDLDKYLSLLNAERQKNGLKTLKYQPKLADSALKIGVSILKFNDFSLEATRSGYTMKQSMVDAGYSNIVTGETLAPGYFEAEELFDALFEFPNQKKFLLEKDFEEIGIAEVEGQVNGCTTQVIVQQLGGFLPPNYKSEDIQNWRVALSRLKDIQSGWNDLKNSEGFYSNHKSEVDRINQIIDIRIRNMESVIKTMEANQWLSSEQQNYAKQDETLSKEQNDIADKLNSS